METILASLISSSVTGIFAVIVCTINNKRQNTVTRNLLEYKMDELTKRVDKHNSLVERTFLVEQKQAVFEEQMKVANHRIFDLESGVAK